MECVDKGHLYVVDEYAPHAGWPCLYEQKIRFIKKIGERFPGNEGQEWSGTNCQELLRVLIKRCLYLNSQIPCAETPAVIEHLRSALLLFEQRAERVKGLSLGPYPLCIEDVPTCRVCGHIHKHSHV